MRSSQTPTRPCLDCLLDTGSVLPRCTALRIPVCQSPLNDTYAAPPFAAPPSRRTSIGSYRIGLGVSSDGSRDWPMRTRQLTPRLVPHLRPVEFASGSAERPVGSTAAAGRLLRSTAASAAAAPEYRRPHGRRIRRLIRRCPAAPALAEVKKMSRPRGRDDALPAAPARRRSCSRSLLRHVPQAVRAGPE